MEVLLRKKTQFIVYFDFLFRALDYYYFQNEVIGGEFEPYNYFMGWYPHYASSHLIKTPNNTNSYAFNTSNLYVSYHLTLTADQMYNNPQILFEIENEDEPDRPYIGMVSKSLNFGGMPAVRTDFSNPISKNCKS